MPDRAQRPHHRRPQPRERPACRPSTTANIEILRFFADAAAIVIQRAILHRQLLDRRRLDDQLRLAQEVQAGLLPAHGARSSRATRMAGRCIPTFEIGGDCFDYLAAARRPPRRGASPTSRARASRPRWSWRRSAPWSAPTRAAIPHPAALAAATNRWLPEHIASGVVRDGVLRRARARRPAPSPTSTAATTRRCWCVATAPPRNSPAAACPWAPSPTHAIARPRWCWSAGDVLAIYTDGVVENDDDECGDFGAARLAEVIARHRARSPQEIVDLVVAETRQYHGISTYPDDFTLLVIQRRPRACVKRWQRRAEGHQVLERRCVPPPFARTSGGGPRGNASRRNPAWRSGGRRARAPWRAPRAGWSARLGPSSPRTCASHVERLGLGRIERSCRPGS